MIDEDCTGEKICGVPVVAGESDVPMYVCQEWIDEVLIVISEDLPYPDGLIDKLTENRRNCSSEPCKKLPTRLAKDSLWKKLEAIQF